MGSMITMKVCRPSGKSHSTLFPNFHEEVMYESVDNSRNDCINENKELDNQEQHKLHCGKRPDCFGTKYTGSCHVPTQFHMYVIELMQVNSKGAARVAKSRQFSTRVIEGWLKY
jgi:hypothetical protein